MAGAGVPVPMDDGLAMRGCGRLGTPHRKALSDRAAVYYNSRVRSWGLGRLQEMLRLAGDAARPSKKASKPTKPSGAGAGAGSGFVELQFPEV